MRRLTAVELIAHLTDAESWQCWDSPAEIRTADPGYIAELAAASTRTGCDEAVVTGTARIGGHRVALVVGEFGFLAGSIGVAAAERVTRAVRRATADGLPLIATPASGGTRMQEGTTAFLQMIRITAAVTAHKAAGLPYLVYLRHPTTGGVFASWGSLGHLTFAEPNALIGFLGPRVYQALHHERFPDGVQTAENLHARGIIDQVVAPDSIGSVLASVLTVTRSPTSAAREPRLLNDFVGDRADAWDVIGRSRRIDRPGSRELLASAATDVVRLRSGGCDSGIIVALARFGGLPAVVIAQDRAAQVRSPMGTAALAAARHAVGLAEGLSLPVVSIIDTQGAELSRRAEEAGIAVEIAECLAALITTPTSTVSVLLGQGTGGGALALLPADITLAAQHAWLAPLPPEGASAIIHRDTGHAAELARVQGITAADLLASGAADAVIPELPDAADEPQAFCARVVVALHHALAELSGRDRQSLRAERMSRYDRIGDGVGLAHAR